MIGSDEIMLYLNHKYPGHRWKYFSDMDISSMCIRESFRCRECGFMIYISRAAKREYERTAFTQSRISAHDIPVSCSAARMAEALE